MKRLMALTAFLFSSHVSATVDGHDRVFIVVQDIQSEEFFLERVPVIGCYGLPQGARLAQFTAPYKAPANIGCGGPAVEENINALSCGRVTHSEESKDYMSFSKITLDISKCPAKNEKRFITLIRTAAARNFPQTNGKEVELTIVK